MSFSANQSAKDIDENPIEPGAYRVQRGGQVRLGVVFEDEELTLWVRFAGEERPQRVDELSQFCCWSKAEESDSTDLDSGTETA